MTQEIIQAAGAVLWRRLSDDLLQIALIHRPRYNDWSFPKGKQEEGETAITCAYREVLEETGYESLFGPDLGEIHYDVEGVKKRVRYWSAEAEVGQARLAARVFQAPFLLGSGDLRWASFHCQPQGFVALLPMT